MRLSTTELGKLLAILEKIDQGIVQPRMPNRMGRFLRQYANGRALLTKVLTDSGTGRRHDSAISGRALGTVDVHQILRPVVRVLEFPLGELAETLAISEELGCLTNVLMWLKAPIANAAHNTLRQHANLRLEGDFRWTPPSRLTPGEAQLRPVARKVTWRDARCLKGVADDLIRPPHALEYVLDYRIGPPGLKYFRCVCAMRKQREWIVLPALLQPRPLEVAGVRRNVLRKLKSTDLASFLIYREPWSAAWTIVESFPITADQAFTHAISWADFQKELMGSEIDGDIIGGIRESLSALRVRRPPDEGRYLTRNLLPVSRAVLRSLRGIR